MGTKQMDGNHMGTKRGSIRIGTSGWLYPPWRGVFYPKGLPHRRELSYLASQVNSVELNGSFYSLQRPTSYQAWHDQTPDDFTFAVKGGRFITHMKRLNDVTTPLANFFASGVLALRAKLGPILWQLPPTLQYDASLLHAFFNLLPSTTEDVAQLAGRHDDRVEPYTTVDVNQPVRHALEVRHPSFTDPGLPDVLRAHDIALVVADAAANWPYLEHVTTDFMYIRLHGDTELYASGYTDSSLDTWAERIDGYASSGLDVYAYFDNDMKVKAPRDACALTDRLTPATRS